ncbi:mucin-like protein [Ciona intestinalis]
MGKSWQVNESESLFTYTNDRNYTFYNPTNHTPPFLTAEVAALNNETLQSYLTTCGQTNFACLYDYAVTGNRQLAVTSGNIVNEARQLHSLSTNRAPTLTYETNQTSTVVEGTIRVMVGQTINIQFNGSDADGDALTYSVNNNEIAGTSINGSGYFTFVVTSSNLNINVSGDVPTLIVQVIDGLASAVVEVKVLMCDCAGNGTCLWDRPLQLGTPSYGVSGGGGAVEIRKDYKRNKFKE